MRLSGWRGARGSTPARNSPRSRTRAENAAARSAQAGSSPSTCPSSFRCEPQPDGVHDHGLDALERLDQPAGEARPSSPRPACSESAPQQPWGGATTSYPSAASTRAVAALTEPNTTDCTQPVRMPTRPRVSPRAGVLRSGPLGRAPRRRDLRHRAEPPGERELAAERREPQRGAQAPRIREQLEEQRRARAGRRPARRVVGLDRLARRLDQPVVLDARRAGGHACHAAEAEVEVADDRRVERDRPVEVRLHQLDPAARRVHLLAPEQVRRAGGQAEAAVHAVARQRAEDVGRSAHASTRCRVEALPAPAPAAPHAARRTRRHRLRARRRCRRPGGRSPPGRVRGTPRSAPGANDACPCGGALARRATRPTPSSSARSPPTSAWVASTCAARPPRPPRTGRRHGPGGGRRARSGRAASA